MLPPRLTLVGGIPSRQRQRSGATTSHRAVPSDFPLGCLQRPPPLPGIVIGRDRGILHRWKPHTGAFLPKRRPGSGVIIKPDNDTQRWTCVAIAEREDGPCLSTTRILSSIGKLTYSSFWSSCASQA